MTKPQGILCNAACWLVLGSFAAVSVWYGWYVHRLFDEVARSPSKVLFCGNCVTGPLGMILSFGTPASLTAAGGLAGLARRGSANRWAGMTAAALTVICTTGLLAFGLHFFRGNLPGHPLSGIVWWLQPFGV